MKKRPRIPPVDPSLVRAALASYLKDIPSDQLVVERTASGHFNTSYYIRGHGIDWVIRIAPHDSTVFLFYERKMMKQEPVIHDLLRHKTNVPVPMVIALDESRSVIDRDFIIMERLPGQAWSETPPPDPDSVLRELGSCLAQVHAITANSYGYLGPHRPMDPQPSWFEAFRVMWRMLLADVASTGHYSAEEAARLAKLLEKHYGAFMHDPPASLLHMDIWMQNILVDSQGRLTGLIDWDRALWGDPEIEFAVLDYCGISEPTFWEGYGAQRDMSESAQIRRIFYLLYEIQKYIVIRHGRDGSPDSARTFKQQTFRLAARLF